MYMYRHVRIIIEECIEYALVWTSVLTLDAPICITFLQWTNTFSQYVCTEVPLCMCMLIIHVHTCIQLLQNDLFELGKADILNHVASLQVFKPATWYVYVYIHVRTFVYLNDTECGTAYQLYIQ